MRQSPIDSLPKFTLIKKKEKQVAFGAKRRRTVKIDRKSNDSIVLKPKNDVF